MNRATHQSRKKTYTRAVLFDIDGTLLKCAGAGKKSLIRACRETFGTIGRMEDVDFQGKTDPWILTESLGIAGFTKDDIDRNIDLLKERYFRHLRKNMHDGASILLPGVGELLEKLSQRETVLIGLLTGNFSESARIKLGRFNLNEFFSFGVYGDDAADRNDMPAIARALIRERFHNTIQFNEIVIIGDTVYDIQCARRAGSMSIAVGTGWIEKEILLSHNPDYFFDDLSETEAVIGAIMS